MKTITKKFFGNDEFSGQSRVVLTGNYFMFYDDEVKSTAVWETESNGWIWMPLGEDYAVQISNVKKDKEGFQESHKGTTLVNLLY
jgi:hypothetical protein